MIGALFTKLFGPLAPGEVVRPSLARTDLWLCFAPDEAPPFADRITIAYHDCDTPIVDQASAPQEPKKLCLRCYGARWAGGRA